MGGGGVCGGFYLSILFHLVAAEVDDQPIFLLQVLSYSSASTSVMQAMSFPFSLRLLGSVNFESKQYLTTPEVCSFDKEDTNRLKVVSLWRC